VALLTASERAELARFSTVNQSVNLGQRVADAQTLQFYGDSATSHVRLAALPQATDTLRLEAGGAMDRTGVFDPGCDVTYEFTSTGAVQTPGAIAVLIGATLAACATALAQAITPTTTNAVVAEAHSIDTAIVDICHNTPGASLTLSSSAPSRIVTQNNQEGLPLGEYVYIIRKRTITNEDVTRGRLRFDTGWTSIVEGFASLYRSIQDQTPENYNGTVSMVQGVLELTQGTGTGQWAAGSILQLQLLGVR
jgi:hypothetical protein